MQPPPGGYGPPTGGGYGQPPYGPPQQPWPTPPPYGPPQMPQAPPPQRGPSSGLTIALIVGGVLAVFGLGTCGLLFGLGLRGQQGQGAPQTQGNKTAYVYVSCEGAPASGFNCTVTHQRGNANANACWNIRAQCDNTFVSGHACQNVQVGGQSFRYVGPNELKNAYVCNRMTGVTVENVAVTVQ